MERKVGEREQEAECGLPAGLEGAGEDQTGDEPGRRMRQQREGALLPLEVRKKGESHLALLGATLMQVPPMTATQ